MSKYLITISELIAQLNYEPETGIFTWKKAKRGHTKAGAKAGTIRPNGYINITINRKPYYAHRLAWFYTTGQWPTHHIDHINGVRDDNRIENLREASAQENQHNRHTPDKGNTSGYIGVSWMKSRQKWRTRICADKKEIHLGLFDAAEEAYASYLKAKAILHPYGMETKNVR